MNGSRQRSSFIIHHSPGWVAVASGIIATRIGTVLGVLAASFGSLIDALDPRPRS